MDLLQIALVFLILLLSVILAILGIQVFFILKDLRKTMDKVELFLGDAQQIAEDVSKPIRAAAEVTQAVEAGVKVVKSLVQNKPPKRLLFKRKA